MARIVAVHGVGQQLKGRSTLHRIWLPALQDGIRLAGGGIASSDLSCAFYGDLFRPKGRTLAVATPPLTAKDVQAGFDADLLELWWAEAAVVDDNVIDPRARTLVRTPSTVQAALRALTNSRFFAGLALRALIFDLHQVRRYFTEPTLRMEIRRRVMQALSDDTEVVVAHSLGTVVAYEALHQQPSRPPCTFVTLGSPLGIRNLIFDRLDPAPFSDDCGRLAAKWPECVKSWTNIVDLADVVALVKDLRYLFGDRINGISIANGAKAHDVTPYLTAVETGAAILSGLQDE